MKEIKLTQGKVALVDDEDLEYLNQFKWCILKKKHNYYAIRFIYFNGRKKHLLMHRVIMNTPKGMQVDHIDHDGLNCQKHNMRNCTNGQNQRNKRKYKSNKYVNNNYKGVNITYGKCKDKECKYIRSYIYHDNERICLGSFATEKMAALAYNKAAIKYHGEFACLNNI